MSSSIERIPSRDPTVKNRSLARSTSLVRPACALILHLLRPRSPSPGRDRDHTQSTRAAVALIRRIATFASSQPGGNARRSPQPRGQAHPPSGGCAGDVHCLRRARHWVSRRLLVRRPGLKDHPLDDGDGGVPLSTLLLNVVTERLIGGNP